MTFGKALEPIKGLFGNLNPEFGASGIPSLIIENIYRRIPELRLWLAYEV